MLSEAIFILATKKPISGGEENSWAQRCQSSALRIFRRTKDAIRSY
jgi:hypothetical protein